MMLPPVVCSLIKSSIPMADKCVISLFQLFFFFFSFHFSTVKFENASKISTIKIWLFFSDDVTPTTSLSVPLHLSLYKEQTGTGIDKADSEQHCQLTLTHRLLNICLAIHMICFSLCFLSLSPPSFPPRLLKTAADGFILQTTWFTSLSGAARALALLVLSEQCLRCHIHWIPVGNFSWNGGTDRHEKCSLSNIVFHNGLLKLRIHCVNRSVRTEAE